MMPQSRSRFSRRARARAQVWMLTLAAGALVATAQCGPMDGVMPPPRRTSYGVTVRGVNAQSTNALGWEVTVEQAAITAGPVRFFEGSPLFGRRMLRRLTAGFGVALAHPGHYVPGEALGDVTTQRAVDLIAQTGTAMERAEAVTGVVQSATFELRPPRGELGSNTEMLHGGSVWVRGVARRGDVTVRFEGASMIDAAVEGIPAHGRVTGVSDLARWDIAVNLGAWFAQADFARLPAPSSPEGYAPIADTEVSNALYRAVTTATPYRFTWLDDGQAPGEP